MGSGRSTPYGEHSTDVCDFVLMCACRGTLLSPGGADASMWVGLGHAFPNGSNPTVTGSQAGDCRS